MGKRLVLVGGGHAHVHVVRALGLAPEPGVGATLVSRDLLTPYSGMLPGLVAGLHDHEEAHIDLVRLAGSSGVTLLHGEMTGLDAAGRRVILADGRALAYDVLSLDTGSAPQLDAPGARDLAWPVKPVAPFLARWRSLVEAAERTGRAPSIAVVGGGAGGVETALAMAARLGRALGGGRARIALATREELLPRFNPRARRLLARALEARGIAVVEHAPVARVEAGGLVTGSGEMIEAEVVVWAAWAGAPSWLRATGLALDPRGFVAVDEGLRSTSHPDVFAAGDVAAVLAHPREKAGVFAVRQGPPLARNLRLALRGRAPEPFVPQRRALALVGTGERRAVAAWGPLAAEGAWVWRAKEWIDRRWIAGYRS